RRLILGAAVAVTASLVWPRSPVSGGPARAVGDGPGAAAEAKWQGVASCSAMACHHGPGPKGRKRAEYSTWAAHDKPARAYQVLFNVRSVRIARNLDQKGPDGNALPAHQIPLCLKCHATGEAEVKEQADGTLTGADWRFQLADGVGCESCHGKADKW